MTPINGLDQWGRKLHNPEGNINARSKSADLIGDQLSQIEASQKVLAKGQEVREGQDQGEVQDKNTLEDHSLENIGN